MIRFRAKPKNSSDANSYFTTNANSHFHFKFNALLTVVRMIIWDSVTAGICCQGYGHITPKTNSGRVVTIIYAIVGIPLTLLTVTHIGGFMATSFRFLYRMAKNACLCRSKSLFACRRCRSTSAERDRKQTSVVNGSQKPLSTVRRVKFDHSTPTYAVGRNENCAEMAPDGGGPVARTTYDVADAGADEDKELTAVDGVVPISSCVAAVGVAMAGVATSNTVRRQSTIERLTRLREQIGVGLHSADRVRVPIWLSLLLVVVYIAVGAVMFSTWESVGVTSQSLLCCSFARTHSSTRIYQ